MMEPIVIPITLFSLAFASYREITMNIMYHCSYYHV